MNLKGMLKVSTSLMVCGVLFSSLAQAEDYVTKSQVNAANGIAGLNSQGNVTAPISSPQVKVSAQYKDANGSIVNRPAIKMIPDSLSMFTLGKETVQFGGDKDIYNNPVSRSLSVIGRPYGNYNAGCTLCIFSTSSDMTGGGAQAAISGINYASGANAVANGDMVAVGFYHFDENSPARVVKEAASFGSKVVTLSSPMKDEEMSQLQVGMYVATNVVDPNASGNSTLINPKRYWGFIKSWDANHIYVYDWAVLGGGNSANDQVPDIHYLDNQLSTYTVPMIFVGTPSKVFAENEYMNADGSRVLGANATAVANQYEREEFDFRARNWTKPNSLSFHGWTTSFTCRPNCDPKAVSEDSYAYLVNGPDGLPKAYVAQTVGDALEFSGYSTFIGGNGAPQSVDANGNTSDGVVGSNHIMSSFASGLSSNNTIHMNTLVNRDSVAANDWRDYSVRLVMDVDSQRDRKKGLSGGSRMGSIAFNYNAAHYGGICLLGSDAHQGLCQEADGSVNFAKKVTINSDMLVSNSLTVSQQVKAPKFVGTLSTPSSSSASCNAGEFKDDTNYHYVCVAANKWKRVALSDF